MKELPPPAPAAATLELLEVDAALARIGSLAGAGSQAARRTDLHDLFARATDDEQALPSRAPDGRDPPGRARGRDGRCRLEGRGRAARRGPASRDARGRPRRRGRGRPHGRRRGPRAASGSRSSRRCSRCSRSPRRTSPRRFERIRPAAVEWKLDGARIQVHRLGDEVRVFTRNLADVTDRVPEIVEAIRRVPIGGGDPRRRGDRAPARPATAPVRPDDEPVRQPEPEGPRGAPDRVSAVAVRLRRPPSRRRGPDRPAGHRAVRRARRTTSPRSSACRGS